VRGRVLGESRSRERRLDAGAKSLSGPMCVTPGQATSPVVKTGLVGVLWLLDAVRRHEDRAGEGVELLALVLPRAAVVPLEVRILLESRIGEARKHSAVV
jgi:hypothetical protein